MKNKILILLALALLTSCFDQDMDGCPEDMHLTFSIEDAYEPEDFDRRLANDAMLYIFKDKRVVSDTLIPYNLISGGKEFVIRKDDKLSGNLDLLVWAVPVGRDHTLIPKHSIGDNIDDIYLELKTITPAEKDFYPTPCLLHIARLTINEPVDKQTWHELKLNYSECRMEVKVTDNDNYLSQPGADPQVSVYGTMSQMDMNLEGVGNAADVHAKLICPLSDNINFTTGRFGVMPSQDNRTVSVDISDGASALVTLTVPTSALPQRSISGGLIKFEYTLGAPSFTIEMNGFRQVIVIVGGM